MKRLAVLALVFVAVVPFVSADTTHFRLNETSGTNVIDYGGFANGTNNGAQQGVTGIDKNNGGDWGDGLAYNFSNDHIDMAENYGIFGGSSDFTVSMWIKPRNVTNDFEIFTPRGENNLLIGFLSPSPDGYISARAEIDGTWASRARAKVSRNNWHHVTVTYNSNNGWKMYINATQKDSNATTGSINSKSQDNRIGSSGTSDKNHYPGLLDEFKIYDKTLNSTEITNLYEYNNVSGSSITNFTVKAEDAFDQSTIQNFSANLTGQTTGTTYDLNTTTGTLTTPVLSNSSELWDVRVDSQGYQNRTYQDVNVSQNTTLTAELKQAESRFTEARTKVSNQSLTSFNVTVDNKTFASNTTFASPTAYNATFTKTGWYNRTEYYSQATLNQTFTNVYDHRLNITASEIRQGLTVQNYTGWIAAENHDYNETFTTQNTSQNTTTVNLEANTTYTAQITNTSDDFALRYQNGTPIMRKTFTTPANKSSNVSFQTYTYNSVEFNVQDIDTLNTLNQTTNISLINGPEDRELNNTNGSIFTDDLLTGSYTARIQSNGYATQDYFFEVGASTYQTINVYLDAQTTQIFFTVLDGQQNPVEGAVMTMNTKKNGSSVIVGQKRTDFSGTASFLLNPDKTYTFTVTKQGFQTFEGTVTPTLTEYNVVLSDEGQKTYTTPYNDFQHYTNVTTGNNTFVWEWSITSPSASIQRANYTFTYNKTTYSDTTTQSNGRRFTENITLADSQDRLTVNYEVQTTTGTVRFQRTFNLRQTRQGATDTFDVQAGPVTKAIIAYTVIVMAALVIFLASTNVTATTLVVAAMIGFFTWVNFLPLTAGIVTVILEIILAISYQRRRGSING